MMRRRQECVHQRKATAAVGTGKKWKEASVVRAQQKTGSVTRDGVGVSPEAGSPGISQDECGVHPRDEGALRAT